MGQNCSCINRDKILFEPELNSEDSTKSLRPTDDESYAKTGIVKVNEEDQPVMALQNRQSLSLTTLSVNDGQGGAAASSKENISMVIKDFSEEKNNIKEIHRETPKFDVKTESKSKQTAVEKIPVKPKESLSIADKFNNDRNLKLLVRLQNHRRFQANNEFNYFTEEGKKVQRGERKLTLFRTTPFCNKLSLEKPYSYLGYKEYYDESKIEDKELIDSLKKLDLTSNKRSLRIVADNYIYLGEVNDHLNPDGYGVKQMSNGDIYKGIWTDGVLEGWVRIFKKGQCIDGIYKNGEFNGKGVIHYESDASYVGSLCNSTKQGYGKEISKNYEYIGKFNNGKKEGEGKIIFIAKNEEYTGTFSDDQIHGKGTYIFSNKNVYIGTFVQGKMHGKNGLFKWTDGSEYVGEYKDNIKEGIGKFKWRDGRVYDGPFLNGKIHGRGKITYKNNVYEVEFEDGKIIKDKSKKITEAKVKEKQNEAIAVVDSYAPPFPS